MNQADGDGAARRGAADGKCQRGLARAAYLRESADAVHLRDFAASVYLASDHRRVLLKSRLIPSAFENPNYSGDAVWQGRFTLACFAISIAAATLLTYGFERPVARRLGKKPS